MNNILRNKRNQLWVVGGLLVGAFTFFSCDSDEEEDPAYSGDAIKSYLSLRPNGVSEISVASNDENYVYPLEVKRLGLGNASGTALIEAWTEDEMETYNKKEKTEYKLLPASAYALSTSEVSFSGDVSLADVNLTVNPSAVFPDFKASGAQYVIGLKMTSDNMKVRSRHDKLLLPLKFNYPTLSFSASNGEVSASESEVTASVEVAYKYKVDGESVGATRDFQCKLSVPDNAAALVTAYNKASKTSYKLLPTANYNLGEGVSFQSGNTTASADITIKSDGMEVVDYLLPLTLGECTDQGVVCSDGIFYLKAGRTYTNPVISYTSAADPCVIRAKDGYFYLYATHTGNYWMPIYKSKDLVHWDYQKTAFRNATKPKADVMPGGGAFWAPEMRIINDKYVLYYSWAKWGDGSQSYTAVATSDSPLGDFADSKALLTVDEFGSNCIDQYYFEDGGTKYMFVGSFNGIYVTELTDDGLSVKRGSDGKPVLKQKVAGNAFEGTNIWKKGKYYYLFASINNCCSGESSKYKVVVGRSESVLGPYVNKDGKRMLDNKWELVLEGDGKKYFGPGHNSILITDDAGTDWMVYHSYVKENGSVGGRLGMLDPVQWSSDGWPYIKNCFPSDGGLIPVFK